MFTAKRSEGIMKFPYWYCPNDESHPLEFFPRWQSSRTRCKHCLVDAVMGVPPYFIKA